MHFAREMLEAQKILEELGHVGITPKDTHKYLVDPNIKENFDLCVKNDVLNDHFNKIAASDVILVLNYPKNNINGYIGGAVLMEIAVARHLDKKIFLLHDLPNEDELKYVLEVKLTKPVILEGKIKKISEYL